jgi:hypothetical protein
MIRTVIFTQQKIRNIEPNQLPNWLISVRTKKEHSCVAGTAAPFEALAEALWIKAKRACRAKSEV